MSEKIIVTKFLRDESQIKQDFLCLLMKDENAPLDVSYRVNLIKIQKEYYPFAIFDVTIEAAWQATSYWEHEERTKVPRTETVYIDYRGNEQKSPGQDTEVKNGKIYTHYRRPMSRTVYDTKTEIQIDNIERTHGYVQPTKFSEIVWTGKGVSLLNWTEHFTSSQMLEVKQDFFTDYVLIPEVITRDEAQSQAEKMGIDDMGRVVSNNVPGTRYEELTFDWSLLNIDRTSKFLGVYHIFYEYEGKSYECLMCGGDKVDDVVIGDHPVDYSIKERTDALKAEIDKNGNFSKKSLFLLGAVLLTFTTYGCVVTGWMIGTLLFGSVDIYCIIRFIQMKKRKKQSENEIANLNQNNTLLKQQIYDLIQKDLISEEKKRQMIEEMLKAHDTKLNYEDEKKEQLKQEYKDRFKKYGILSTIVILAIGVVIFFSSRLFSSKLQTTQVNTEIKKSDNGDTEISHSDKDTDNYNQVNSNRLDTSEVKKIGNEPEGYSLVKFKDLSFELPNEIDFIVDSNERGMLNFLSGSGGMIFAEYDSSGYNINSNNVEDHYDLMISATIQDYNPQDIYSYATTLDGCMAKCVQCRLYLEDDWRAAIIMAVCNKNYSRMYVITTTIFNKNIYTDDDGSVLEHILDTIDLP